MARQERSAGVILFRPQPSAPGGRVYLLLDYGKHWDYPKGHLRKGEDDVAAARRELAEETGIDDAQLLPEFRHEMVYFFRSPKKGLVRKTVSFFLGTTATAEVHLSEEHVGSAWLPYDQALARLTFPNAAQALREAEAFVARHPEMAG